jgi:bifunctional ADP-heptose synthase (sugar kinase/adenylyltransferase)
MIEQNIQQHRLFKILLIGDSCIDEYQYGKIDRISPEAPVPIFNLTTKEVKPGMAANVQGNLVALGCMISFITGAPSKKLRLIDQRSKQHVLRIDDDVISAAITINDVGDLDMCDAVVISDYNKGLVSYELIEQIIKKSNHGVKFPVFVDTKKTDLERLQGAWVKINSLEYSLIKSECTGLIVTMGENGAKVPHHDLYLPSPRVEVSDVCGAGDTFLAALTVGWLETHNIEQAIQFANTAASIAVQHSGAHTLTQQDINYIYETLNYGV